ncbi:MAG TPA: hypothetical protein PLV59_00365 [Candidatus Dojkabacteria bacterium]|nr:hypothetical protein [Candidatus Dojkabacteria bacterium]
MGLGLKIENFFLSGDARLALQKRVDASPEQDIDTLSKFNKAKSEKLPLKDTFGNLEIPAYEVTTNIPSTTKGKHLGIIQIHPNGEEELPYQSIGFDPERDPTPREKLKGGGAKVIDISMKGCRIIGINRPAIGAQHPVQDASGVTFYRSKGGDIHIGLHVCDGNTGLEISEDELSPSQKDKYIKTKRYDKTSVKIIGESEYYSTRGARNSSRSILEGSANAARFLVNHFVEERQEMGIETPKGGSTLQATRLVIGKKNMLIDATCLGVDSRTAPNGVGDLGYMALVTKEKGIEMIDIQGNSEFDLSHDPVRSRYGFDIIQPTIQTEVSKGIFIITTDGFKLDDNGIKKLTQVVNNPDSAERVRQLQNKDLLTEIFGASYDDGTCWIVMSTENSPNAITRRQERAMQVETTSSEIIKNLDAIKEQSKTFLKINYAEVSTEVEEFERLLRAKTSPSDKMQGLQTRYEHISGTLKEMVDLELTVARIEAQINLIHVTDTITNNLTNYQVDDRLAGFLRLLYTDKPGSIPKKVSNPKDREVLANIINVLEVNSIIEFKGKSGKEILENFRKTGDSDSLKQLIGRIKNRPSSDSIELVIQATKNGGKSKKSITASHRETSKALFDSASSKLSELERQIQAMRETKI